MKTLLSGILVASVMLLGGAKQFQVGTRSFTPSSGGGGSSCTTSGIVATYDADSYSSSPVTTTWTDGSGHHYDLDVVHGAPVWTANVFGTHAALTFDGSSTFFECYNSTGCATGGTGSGIPMSAPITVYVVMSTTNAAATQAITGNNGFGNAFVYRLSSSQQDSLWQSTADLGYGSTTLTSNTQYVSAVSYNKTAGTIAYYLNNTSSGTPTSSAAAITAGIESIGAAGAGSYNFSGQISLITVTNTTYDATYEACLVTNRP